MVYQMIQCVPCSSRLGRAPFTERLYFCFVLLWFVSTCIPRRVMELGTSRDCVGGAPPPLPRPCAARTVWQYPFGGYALCWTFFPRLGCVDGAHVARPVEQSLRMRDTPTPRMCC